MTDVVHVRPAVASDRDAMVRMRVALWPDGSLADHARDVDDYLAGRNASSLPLVNLVAEDAGEVLGFVEADLRSHADGCDVSRPVGYIEGWFVVESRRRSGVGAALVAAAEAWARAQGCVEMASDTWSDARGATSEIAHAALGYEVVDRVVHFRKALR